MCIVESKYQVLFIVLVITPLLLLMEVIVVVLLELCGIVFIIRFIFYYLHIFVFILGADFMYIQRMNLIILLLSYYTHHIDMTGQHMTALLH